jgi:hypothetical protein
MPVRVSALISVEKKEISREQQKDHAWKQIENVAQKAD